MVVKSLHQIFYYHSKYLNSMKCREISMGPSIRTIQCTSYVLAEVSASPPDNKPDHCHQRTQFLDFSIFGLLHFFWHFFPKIGV
jgi:hypothetical protein